MKTALFIAAGLGAYVLVRRQQLGHVPHSLKELLPFLPGACCASCAGASSGPGSAATKATNLDAAGADTPPFVPEVYEQATLVGDLGPFAGISPVYGSGLGRGGGCAS